MFSNLILKQFPKTNRLLIRQKHSSDHWSVLKKKIHPTDKALTHFDDFYKQIFRKKWLSIREGLLGKQKYVAIVNNYADNEETKRKFEVIGALNVRRLFELEKEYVRERKKSNERQKRLEEIWEMDKEMEEKLIKEEQVGKIVDYSLKSSLESANYDRKRLVDTKIALSSEILHEFVPATKIKGKEDFIPESEHYKYYDNTSNFNPMIEKEYDFHFPEHLDIYCFEFDNLSDFEPAKCGSTGVLNYYLMDGGSILPVLALDIHPGNRVLDLCAAPGGKSLLALQTMYPDCVISNDISMSRLDRIYNVYNQFLYDLKEKWLDSGRIKITRTDGRHIPDDNYDRILVDVPCTTDRHSLKENENNIFKPSRIKERLKLPELQCELLVHALKLVKKGGVVVYSTCSLSPIQNDGVVHMALKQIWEETRINIVVKDLGPALHQTGSVFHLADQKLMKYGHLVLPFRSQNYGPTYFCKLKRIN